MADSRAIAAVLRPRAGADGGGLGASCRRVVLVAPRLVDEVRAVGLLAPLDGAAPEVDLLGLTSPVSAADPDDSDDSDDSDDPEAVEDTPDDAHDPHHAAVLAAYARVGAGDVRRHRLGLVAGEVAAREPDVVAALSEILGWAHPTGLCVLAPPSGDPGADTAAGPDRADADAAGRAAELVCAAYRVRLLTWDAPGPATSPGPVTSPGRTTDLAATAGA